MFAQGPGKGLATLGLLYAVFPYISVKNNTFRKSDLHTELKLWTFYGSDFVVVRHYIILFTDN